MVYLQRYTSNGISPIVYLQWYTSTGIPPMVYLQQYTSNVITPMVYLQRYLQQYTYNCTYNSKPTMVYLKQYTSISIVLNLRQRAYKVQDMHWTETVFFACLCNVYMFKTIQYGRLHTGSVLHHTTNSVVGWCPPLCSYCGPCLLNRQLIYITRYSRVIHQLLDIYIYSYPF